MSNGTTTTSMKPGDKVVVLQSTYWTVNRGDQGTINRVYSATRSGRKLFAVQIGLDKPAFIFYEDELRPA